MWGKKKPGTVCSSGVVFRACRRWRVAKTSSSFHSNTIWFAGSIRCPPFGCSKYWTSTTTKSKEYRVWTRSLLSECWCSVKTGIVVSSWRPLHYYTQGLGPVDGLPVISVFLPVYWPLYFQVKNMKRTKMISSTFLSLPLCLFFFSVLFVSWLKLWRRLKTTEGLESLQSLDILDLHGNQIAALTGMSRLRTLRVLNLAANSLKKLPSLDGLVALEELNAKRNRICKIVPEVAHAKRLERLYLSNNELRR